jgi:tetratricopeptide (TPR) repeat protein
VRVARRGRSEDQNHRGRPGLDLFERAVKAFGKKDFERAGELFDKLVEVHPSEQDLVERARVYRVSCQRHRAEGRRAPRPRTFEDLLNHGVFLHNRGEYGPALSALKQAAEIHPRNEHVLYCLAATQARAGDTPAALKALRSAIAVSPANRALARQDPDFESLRRDSEFVALLRPAPETVPSR